ncbi:Nucleic acid-binding, OB-fold containing protein [Trema orientale]|uniref:Nucleic acid-binding, OB-fold containing protein n=1 Tax=Trema orientale TaxID=63057 RepID=A0A2P5CUF5_TREOI|nr:Nucleic acid-binding, OB-fold containing protein [Trema orientale]
MSLVIKKKYTLIPEVAKDETDWTAKVIVAEKAMPHASLRSPTKHQGLLLIDPEGNKIHASIYSNNIPTFEHKLQMTRTYLLSNATVKDAKAEFRQRDDELHWTINTKTTLQEIYENHDDVLPSVYNFTPFTEIQSFMDRFTEINVLAVVIDIRPQRKVQTPISGASTI